MYELRLNSLQLPFNPGEYIKYILNELSLRNYQEVKVFVEDAISQINSSKNNATKEQDKNEGYIWGVFFTFFTKLSSFWQDIENKKYYNSWVALQDSLDSLRSIKKFYVFQSITISFFEKQLLSLEKLYPYSIFSSIGFIESNHECSICHNDMDSDACEHLRGDLYSGEIAYAIVRKIEKLDHIALVHSPLDKRLVVGINDEHPSFKIFIDLISLFDARKMNPINFTEAINLDFMKINPDWVKLSRNEKCFCGSGIKYKKCCIKKEYIKHRHIEFKPCKLI